MSDDVWSPDAWKNRALDGFRDLLQAFEGKSSWPALSDLEHEWLEPRRITSMSGAPLRLVSQVDGGRPARPRNRRDLYDVSVCNGRVPTRPNNWHDFFNVLVLQRVTQPAAVRQMPKPFMRRKKRRPLTTRLHVVSEELL
jgi:hypothetical protein